MYSLLSNADVGVAYFHLLVWLAALVLVGRSVARGTGRRMRWYGWLAVGLLVLAELLMVARLVLFGMQAGYGWVFVGDRKLVTLVPLLIAAGVAGVSLVRLAGMARRGAAVADPLVLVPVQVATVAAVGAFFEKYFPPARPLALNVLIYGGILGIITVLLVRRARRRAGRAWLVRLVTTVVVLGLSGGLVGYAIGSSRLPDTHGMMAGEADLGGGAPVQHVHGTSGARSVTDLAGPRDGEPDRRFTLTAQETQVRLSSGQMFTAWTFNGQIPGPELRMREGELVEVTLVNRLPAAPVTVHWHGIDVPNREDGVAGVTQDAVAPGQSYTYRFRVEEAGTRWYHSHQAGSVQVRRGLFGPLVIEPEQPARAVDEDVMVALHDWDLDGNADTDDDLRPAMGSADMLDRRRLAPGRRVRLRVVNTGHDTKTVALTGTPYRVTALDGTDLVDPGEVSDRQLVIGASSRYDLEFTMPAAPVRLTDLAAPQAGVQFSPDGTGELAPRLDGPEFDPTSYGAGAPAPFDVDSRFDRTFELILEEQYGFYDGNFRARMTVNGQVFPNTPMHLVKEGELIRMRFVNRGDNDHPMHVHGHHFLVLSRNGERLTGSPVWLDTLNVRPGEIWEIGFRADNPGLWMDHCHNFVHAAAGMVLHLAYENVTTPFVVGGPAHNKPE